MAGSLDRVRLDVAVVLLVDPLPARQVGAADQREEDGPGVHAPFRQPVRRLRGYARCRSGAMAGRWRGQAVVNDRIAGQGRRRDAGELDRAGQRSTVRVEAALHDRDVPVGSHPADDRHGQAPAQAHLANLRPAPRDHRGQHSLLRLGDHHLVGGHPRLAPGDRIEVDQDAGPGSVGGLRGGAGDPAGTQVLKSFDEPSLDELEAGLDQQLLGERVADLDRWPF